MTLLYALTYPLTGPIEIFLLVLLIILICPIIFRKIGIPHIVGLIIAGIVVGPYGLDILSRDASFEIFGQVGILYLMFMAAVEINMFHLQKNLGKGVVFGLITFIIPTLFGIFGSRLAFGAPWSTCTLISTMYAAHTLISYPIVSRLGLQNSKPAVIAVCSTIVTVLLALLVLAGVVDASDSGGFRIERFIRLVGLMALYAAGMGLLIHYFTKYFFRKISDQVIQFIYVLAMVFLSSLMAMVIGLEAILGAFYAGLILNRFIPDRSGLMGRIKFVGNAIFIPYFLIGVGMLINVRVIFNSWNVGWVAINMVVVAMVAKWIAALIASKIYGFKGNGRRLMFGLTSGKAAATIAAALIGFQHGILTEDMLNGAVLMILVSCVIASISTQTAAKGLRMEITESEFKKDSETEPGEFARQLVAVANPVTAENLMKLALLMRHRNNKNPVTALFVRNSDDTRRIQAGRNSLGIAVSAAQAVDIEVKDIERYDINVVAGLTNEAKQNQATDIMIGLHRKSNIVDSFFGSMTEQLLNASNKMIFISRCFSPANTMARLIILVPDKAEYETGFQTWVERICNLASQLAAKAIFLAYPTTTSFIRNIIISEGYAIRHEYRELNSWDDFILHSQDINEDDIFIIIGARKGSVSHSSDLEGLPAYLQKNHAHNNLLLIYPEQFGGTSSFRSGI
ncbi:MAG: cation:proton antiporter [Muribaculaceae bacterium]|nr:cation:proton antiporter [Muribaculaceae bacterium]